MSENHDLISRVRSRTPPTILTKRESYAFYDLGLFGNKPLTWRSYQEICESGWNGKVCMRSRKGISRSGTLFNLDISEIPEHIDKWRTERGLLEKDISFNQSMPDNNLILQGELMRSVEGLYLYYTTVKKPMNLAFNEEERHSHCANALQLIKYSFSPESFCDLEDLFEQFPNDVIEFSSYDISVGNIPGRNTIIWEVRNY